MPDYTIDQMLCRPIEVEDTDNYIALAFEAGYGLVNIPKNPKILKENILHACESIKKKVLFPKTEHYHFVLENRVTKEIGGTCGIYAKTGVQQPTFFFRIEKERRFAEELKQDKNLDLMRLVSFSYGPSEVISLYLKSHYRAGGIGRLLSLSRFLFIADNRERFAAEVIAEMRGIIDENGSSLFWDCIGKKFTDFTCSEALSRLQHGRHFIPKVLPTYPFYVAMLPFEAQKVIGEVHPHTKPALKMLMEEGFQKTNDVDVFDGGPKISATVNSLRLIEHSHVATIDHIADEPPTQHPSHIISNRRCSGFRCCLGDVVLSGETLKISRSTAKSLDVDVGSSIRFGTVRSQKNTEL